MAVFRTTVSAVALLALLGACANPEVAPRITPEERNLSCAEIEADVERTSQLKRDARVDDEFQWRYIFVVNGFVSAWRMNRAEQAAQERLEALREIGRAKGCFGAQDKVIGPGTPVTAEPVPGEGI